LSKHDPPIVRLAAQHVFEIFQSAGADTPLVFHNFARTRELVASCRDIAKGSKLEDGDLTVVLLAAWFHDAGYAAARDGDRPKSAELARSFLASQKQPQGLADAVARCIEASDDGAAGNLVNDVLYDALLVPTATKGYLSEMEQVRLERERRNGEPKTDVEWTQTCIAFLESHPFRTRYAQLEYHERRATNLVALHKLLRKQIEEAARQVAEQTKASKGLSRTVEDIFDSLTRNGMRAFAIAERRTATMIQVNGIMISLIVALLPRHVETHRELIAPTLLLLAVNVSTILVSIYSMRVGRKGMQRVWGADAPVYERNLLSLFNQTPLSLDDFIVGMNRLAADPAALKQALLEELYFQRQLMLMRRKMLVISYDVFIIGLAIALLAFGVALFRR